MLTIILWHYLPYFLAKTLKIKSLIKDEQATKKDMIATSKATWCYFVLNTHYFVCIILWPTGWYTVQCLLLLQDIFYIDRKPNFRDYWLLFTSKINQLICFFIYLSINLFFVANNCKLYFNGVCQIGQVDNI